jgi:oligopeptide transport system substrate-binding protein
MFLNLLCLGIFFPVHKSSVEKSTESYCLNPKKIIGNGAYKITDLVHNGYVKLEKNSNYWDADAVKIKKIKFLMLQDPFTDMQAFDSGTLDITCKTLPTRGDMFYKKKYGKSFNEYPILRQDLLIFNLENSKFREGKVRKALTMAINKEFFIEKIIKSGNLSYNPVLETFDEDFKKIYEQMPEYSWTQDKFDKRAIDAYWLLDEFFTEEKPLKITITYPIGTFYKNIAEFIQNSWRKVFKGAVQVKVEAKLDKDLLENLHKGNFEICLYCLNGFCPSPTTFTSFYVSDSVNNFSRYKNTDFDKIFYASLSKTKEDFLADQVKLSKMLLQDFVAIPLFSLPAMKLVNRRVRGFDSKNNILNRYRTKDLYFVE